ncbi:CBS domain-containing protein [Marinithermus hydrothermalis]|nr:CBS domain-containing protein [Marinithermus hydrothermalis]
MQRVADLMTPDPIVIEAHRSVSEAAALMEEQGIGGLPVVEGERLVGILTSRDTRRAHPNRLVVDAMSANPITITPEESILTAYTRMQAAGVERIVVVEAARPVGILTIKTLMHALGSQYDPLTGLPRADLLRYRLEEILSRGEDPTLLFADLDDFGTLNKQYGHVLGDRALKAVAKVLQHFAQNHQGEAFRYGGDEFAILLPKPRREVIPHLDALITAVRALQIDGLPPLGISLGLSGGRREGRIPANSAATADDLINLASQASTLAKRHPQGWRTDPDKTSVTEREP